MTAIERGRDRFNKFKPIINLFIQGISLLPFRLKLKIFNSFKFTSGTKGLAVRYIFLKTLAGKCGDNVSIHPGVYLFELQNLTLGNNVSIHPMCYVDATGGVSIGNDVSIAHGSSIMSTTHKYDDTYIPIKDQGIASKFTNIQDNVWIGAKATVLAGVCISKGSVVAANAVVTSNVKENNIVGGVPAIKIKDRLKDI